MHRERYPAARSRLRPATTTRPSGTKPPTPPRRRSRDHLQGAVSSPRVIPHHSRRGAWLRRALGAEASGSLVVQRNCPGLSCRASRWRSRHRKALHRAERWMCVQHSQTFQPPRPRTFRTLSPSFMNLTIAAVGHLRICTYHTVVVAKKSCSSRSCCPVYSSVVLSFSASTMHS